MKGAPVAPFFFGYHWYSMQVALLYDKVTTDRYGASKHPQHTLPFAECSGSPEAVLWH